MYQRTEKIVGNSKQRLQSSCNQERPQSTTITKHGTQSKLEHT